VTDATPADLTAWLRAWSAGDNAVEQPLLLAVYDELRRQARLQLRRERREHSLSPTAVVHEAYLRLLGQRRMEWESREQFFAVAARTMRRVLVDHARRREAVKRAGGAVRVSLDEEVAVELPRELDLLALDDALDELAALDERPVRVVELRFFGGLSLDETAAALAISEATVTREWRRARAWLHRRLGSKAGAAGDSAAEAGPG
jgi:RNA polymerase sigma factor (TIGR02999 family)